MNIQQLLTSPTPAASHERRPEPTLESAMRTPGGCPSQQHRKRPVDERVTAEKHHDKRPRSTRYTCKCGRQFVRDDNYRRHTSYCRRTPTSPADKQGERTDEGSTRPDNGSWILTMTNGQSQESLRLEAVVFIMKESACKRKGYRKQQSPFNAVGGLPTYKTLDTHYEVRPAGKWGEMLSCNVFKCKELPAPDTSGFSLKRSISDHPLGQGEFSIGDFIYVDVESSLAVAIILGIRLCYRTGDTYVRIYWMYRPEDLPRGREQHHGAKELIASNHSMVTYPIFPIAKLM